ncbi:MAG: ferredoxin family protein [Thermincolia bacterium]
MKIDDKLFLNRFLPDSESHLKIISRGECLHDCMEKPCTIFCPSRVYSWDEEAKEIAVAYEGCVECGTCRYGCPFDNIDWRNPRGGFGIMYKYG